ncbi:DUF4113 domain-containing protein [Vibrio antiquarius]|uniref:DUF4113 domain-containing protein n=1 Tax=Vibrio antiquarius (strain Ex25) TaxID=150340 RepID=UPI003D6CFB5B
MRQALVKHAGITSRKLREQRAHTKIMLCFAASSPFDEKPASFKTIHRFSFPTSDVTYLSQVASNAVFDGLNRKYGTDAVFIAAQGIKQEWSMKRQFLSK